MSSYIGPNIYLFECVLQQGLYMSLQNGGKADGTKVVTKSTKTDDKNSHWAIVYAGMGDSGKEEFNVLNRATGTYLGSTWDAKDQDDVTCGLASS
ncbi:hypothetical protein CBER1_05230 [Cercospora berteroae]|uniref:Uncharacterized protein n=1 Tax=Cercospora berteroae TaxID=357750 RepID=A0A2S6BT75_9PEZI|nr:hypothetical protein CBER1_05230 [Cercospora berteroae]